jgi:hypothetical protein
MFEYFYNEIFRKTIIGFGTLFNNIQIKHLNENNDVVSVIKVPLAYGPTQKFLARLEQEPDLNKPIQITLPRMSFEFIGLTYDPSRKLPQTQSFIAASKTDSSDVRKTYMPIPYNMDFELSIMTKLNDDMLQIVEQILAYFGPAYTLTIDLVDTIGEKRDVPITLSNISMQDDYEGDFTTRRALIYTLRFTAKTYIFGPVSSGVGKDIIKKVSLNLISGDSQSTSRDLTYVTTPVATQSYTNNVVTNISNDISTSEVNITVTVATNIPAKSYITIDDETLYVVGKTGNILKVQRGSYGTPITQHVSGTEVKLITVADNELINIGDTFGFDSSF